MTWLRLVPLKVWLGLGLAVLLALGGWWLRHDGYRAGVRTTVAEYLKQDQRGAENARETARRVLGDIGDDRDPLDLLRSTGGLRDGEGEVPDHE